MRLQHKEIAEIREVFPDRGLGGLRKRKTWPGRRAEELPVDSTELDRYKFKCSRRTMFYTDRSNILNVHHIFDNFQLEELGLK